MQLSPAERDLAKVADWLELQVLYSSVGNISLEAARSQIDIDGTLLDEREETEEPESMPSERSEMLVASAVAEIGRREGIVGGSYPFKRYNGLLQLSDNLKSCTPYIFCLLLADREWYTPRDQRSPRLFEHLTREALAAYLNGDAARFGAPRDTMPAGIQDAIQELARITNDEIIKVYPVNDTDNDLGLDVAGWKNFPDRYLTKVEVYMQCATGENWRGKSGECKLETWDKILTCYNHRLVGLAIPYVIADESEWKREASGLLFMDRLRIASVLSWRQLPDDEYNWWQWCEERISMGRQS